MKQFLLKIYDRHRETLHNIFWRGLQVFGKQGITLLIFIICAKTLTQYNFGIYNYVLSITLFLTMFGDFGISMATSKYVAEYSVTDREKLKSVLFNSGMIIFFLTLLIAILTFTLGRTYFKEIYSYVLYLIPLVFLAPLASLYDGIYRGLRRFRALAIISVSNGLVAIVFVTFLIKGYALTGALLAQDIFYLLLVITLGVGYKEFNFRINKAVIKEIGKYSLVYGIAMLGYYLFAKTPTIILGHYGYIDEIATYELINKFFIIFLYPFSIIGQTLAPNFAILKAKGEYAIIYNKSIKYSIQFFVTGLVLGLFLYLTFPFAIKLFFHQYYNETFTHMFPALLLVFVIGVWTCSVDEAIIIPIGYAKLMSVSYIMIAVFFISSCFILIPLKGYISAIYLLLVSNIFMLVLIRVFYFLKLKKLVAQVQ